MPIVSLAKSGTVSGRQGRGYGGDRYARVSSVVRCSRACRELLEASTAAELLALLDAYEAADLEAVSPDLVLVVEAAAWRSVLEARAGRVTREAVTSGRCTGWVVDWLARWPRISSSVSVTVGRRIDVRWLGGRWRGVGKRADKLSGGFAALAEIEAAASAGSPRTSVRVVRASGSDGSVRALAAGARAARALVIRCPAQRGLGLCGSRELARVLASRGAATLVVPDADRLGRVAAPAVADLLAVVGVGVRLGNPDLGGAWRPGSRHSTDDACLDGLCVGPRAALGPGPSVGHGSVLARRPAAHRPTVVVESSAEYPLVFCAAMCARLIPHRVVLLRAAAGPRPRILSAGRAYPLTLPSFVLLGADERLVNRASSVRDEALSARHDAAAAAVLAASSRSRRP